MGKKADPAMIAAMQAEAQNPKISMFDNFKPSSTQYGAPVNQRQTANIHGYEGAMEGIPDMTEYMSQYMQKPADPATMTPESVQGTIPIQTTNLPPGAPPQVPQKVRPSASYSPTVVRPSNNPNKPARAGTGPTPTSEFASAQKAAALRKAAAAVPPPPVAAPVKAAPVKDPKDDPSYWAGRESYGSMKNFDGPYEIGPNNRYYLPREDPLSEKEQQQNERG